jgi:hypothetical protein
VSGPRSTDVYHDYRHSGKFDAVLREIWRDGDDVIYEVPQRTRELVHVVEPAELMERHPKNVVDVDVLRSYVAALENPDRPLLDVRWESPSRATFTGFLKPRQLISVQMAYHAGWHAEANGVTLPLRADAFGFIVVEPNCAAPSCTVRLVFDGGMELWMMRLLQWLSIAMIMVALLRHSLHTRRTSTPQFVNIPRHRPHKVISNTMPQ